MLDSVLLRPVASLFPSAQLDDIDQVSCNGTAQGSPSGQDREKTGKRLEEAKEK